MSALLPASTITTAATTVGPTARIPDWATYLLLEGRLTYGSGGTSVKAYVQTRVTGGTWRDIACFAFTTASASKFSAVLSRIALAAATAVSDGALADDTILNGFLGDDLRVKFVSVGTYAGGTTLAVDVKYRR
jgi:hypothetical protein